MLSLSCRAAIKAVVYLCSKFESGEKSNIPEIAEYINENEHTVGKILQKLSRAGNINSAKGPGGGFYITAAQKKQPLIEIVETIDGLEIFDQCGLGLSKCSAKHPCPLHNEYKPVREMFMELCTKRTVRDLYKSVDTGLAHLT